MSLEEMDSIMNPKLMDGADKIVTFDSLISHIGILTEDDAPLFVRFALQNTGTQPLAITRIRTDCGCTEATPSKSLLQPSEKGVITVVYTPKNHPGTVDASTFVYSSLSDTHPIARLSLLGEVLPSRNVWDRYRYTMGNLKLKQNRVLFDFSRRKVVTERILCGNSGTQDMHLEAVGLPDYIQFYTSPRVITPGEEADIVIRVDATCLTKSITLPLKLKGTNGVESDNVIKLELKLE